MGNLFITLNKQAIFKKFLLVIFILTMHGFGELNAARQKRIKKIGYCQKARKLCFEGKRKFITTITVIFTTYLSLAVFRKFLYGMSLSFALRHPLRVFLNSDLQCLKGKSSPAIIRAEIIGAVAKTDLKEKLKTLQAEYPNKINDNEFIARLNEYFFVKRSLNEFIDRLSGKFNADGMALINEKLQLFRETDQATLQLKTSIINYLEKRALIFNQYLKFENSR